MELPKEFKVKAVNGNGYAVACELINMGFPVQGCHYNTAEEMNDAFCLDNVCGFSVKGGVIAIFADFNLSDFEECEMPLVEITSFGQKTNLQILEKDRRIEEKLSLLANKVKTVNKSTVTKHA
jgi:hypothetical protein